MPKFDWRPQKLPVHKREGPRNPRLHRTQGVTITQFSGREIMEIAQAIHALPGEQYSAQNHRDAIARQFPGWQEARVLYALRAFATVLQAMENGRFSAEQKRELLCAIHLVRVVRDESGRERVVCDR